MATKIMPISDLRRQTSQVVKDVQNDGNAVFITQYGRPVAVLVSFNQYEELSTEIEKLSRLIGEKSRDSS